MSRWDFIYGSKVIIQCQKQINILPCDDRENEYTKYLILIKKDTSFFTHWCKPRHAVKCVVSAPPEEDLDSDVLEKVGTNIDDMLIEQNRSVSWTKATGDLRHVGGSSRHGKQQIIFKAPTFCARDMGITFDPQRGSYTVSN